mmetsp:Transcript_65527/g.154066  ORF Transcript_65527/g.154066 Transcript_65527/m.154066 type:complete len:117 (-) Transcript_65527:216-566(-)
MAFSSSSRTLTAPGHTLTPRGWQARSAGLPSDQMRPAHIVFGLPQVEKKDRVSGFIQCDKADPEQRTLRRWKMAPDMNIYSKEVMDALNSRGGATWLRAQGEEGQAGRPASRRRQR